VTKWPPNKRLQLALQASHRLPCSVMCTGAVGVAALELESFDQLRRSFLTAQLKR
jgi:hypothetical protein